jgi:hypothetical protein
VLPAVDPTEEKVKAIARSCVALVARSQERVEEENLTAKPEFRRSNEQNTSKYSGRVVGIDLIETVSSEFRVIRTEDRPTDRGIVSL